jgi:uncharacterized coiled-coil protein SlyX
LVDNSTTDPEIEGLNLAAAQHKEKMAKIKNELSGLKQKHIGKALNY